MRLLPLRRRVGDRLAQVVHAGDEAGDEVLVVGLLLQHLVDDRQVQRVVAVRAHLPVAGRLARGDRGARVDVGDAHPGRHRGHERLGLLDHQRLDDVAAVEHEVLHVRQVGDEPLVAEAVDRARRVVDVAAAAGVVVEVVRRAERLHERPGQVVEGAAAIGQRDPAPAEDLDRLLQLVGDVVEGLVPGGPPPLAAAARAAADQRRLRPLVVELERQAGRRPSRTGWRRAPCRSGCPAARSPDRPRPSPRSGTAPRTCRTCRRPCVGPGLPHRSRSVPRRSSSQSRDRRPTRCCGHDNPPSRRVRLVLIGALLSRKSELKGRPGLHPATSGRARIALRDCRSAARRRSRTAARAGRGDTITPPSRREKLRWETHGQT